MKIFSGRASKNLAGEIARELKVELSKLEFHIFPDGEKRVRVIDRVVGEDCVVVQSTSTIADINYMELFFICDALKRSGAKSVTAVIPYLGYQRQDHVFRSGEAVSLDVIIRTLETVGVDRVVIIDLHSIKIPELFHIPVVHLSALSLFAEKIKESSKFKVQSSKFGLVSPDMGGIRRIEILSQILGNMPYAAIEKNRDLNSGKIEAQIIHGEVREHAIIIDDMISTGSTIVVAADLLAKKGAKEIMVFATHPVFSKDAHILLQKSKVKKVFVTDTIEIPKDKQFEKLEILSVAEMVAKSLSS